MNKVDWNELAKNKSFQAVIDPLDSDGIKNSLIDQIQWNAISKHLRRNGVILDFGCGIGRFTKRIIDIGLKYSGLDTSIGMIESAKKLYKIDEAHFIHSNQLPLPFSDGHFDICLSVMVLQYLLQKGGKWDSDIVSEIARILAPGGQLLIIEQVSLSGKSSGTVTSCATEANYRETLANYFVIERIEKIRCSQMSHLTWYYLSYGKFLPFRNFTIKLLALIEYKKARGAKREFLNGIDYYDICISARRK